MSELRAMLNRYEEMLTTAKAEFDLEKQALCYNYIAATLRVMGAWDDSRKRQQQGIEIARPLPNPLPLAVALSNMGATCAEMGRYDEALTFLSDSRLISERLENPLRLASAEGSIGKVNIAQGRWDEARSRFSRALSLGIEAKSLRHQMCSYTSLGLTECARGRYAEAEGFLEEARSIAQSLEDAKEANVPGQILPDGSFSLEEQLKCDRDLFVLDLAVANLCRVTAKTDRAIETIDQALAKAKGVGYAYGQTRAQVEKALIHRSAGRSKDGLKAAQAALRSARALGARQIEAEALHAVGLLQHATGIDTAKESISQSISIAESIGDRHTAGRAYIDLGVILLQDGIDPDATLNLLRGLQAMTGLRKVALPAEEIAHISESLATAGQIAEKRAADAFHQLIVLQEESRNAIRERKVESTLESASRFSAALASTFAVARVLLECSSLLVRLTPPSTSQHQNIAAQAAILQSTIEAIRDQRSTIEGEAKALDARLTSFHRQRTERTNLLIQGTQSALSGVGVASIYATLLLQGKSVVSATDIEHVALTLVASACIPIIAFQWIIGKSSLYVRIVTTIVVGIMVSVSTAYLIGGKLT